jgi:hypothetical protein
MLGPHPASRRGPWSERTDTLLEAVKADTLALMAFETKGRREPAHQSSGR